MLFVDHKQRFDSRMKNNKIRLYIQNSQDLTIDTIVI